MCVLVWQVQQCSVTYAFRIISIFRTIFPTLITIQKGTKYPLSHGVQTVEKAFRKAKYIHSFSSWWLYFKYSYNIKWPDLNKMRRHKKEYNLLREKNNLIQDLLRSLNLKAQLYSNSQRPLDKHQGCEYRYFLHHLFMGPFFFLKPM